MYQFNAQGRRERATFGDGSYWSYGYNDRGEVTSGQKKWADESTVAGMQLGYSFDAIGNRLGTDTNGRAATYTPNGLNQYTERTVPGAVDVLGSAAPNATVTVNNQPVTRQGTHFHKALSVENTATPGYPEIKIVGVKNNTGPNGEDAITEQSGRSFVAKTPEAFTYDDDGNLTNDGRWNYTWDAENRLIRMEVLSTLPAVARKKLVFDYDAWGRRIQKAAYAWNPTTSTYDQISSLRFVYDGWNLIAELGGTGAPVRLCLWGLDLSGSEQGAGGVGGLLAVTDAQVVPSQTFFVACDGNGNVTSLIESQTSAVAASYTYGPFGELLTRSGSYMAANPFGFSTKYRDAETGLLYYGNRFLDSQLGRWISRDPIQEAGGMNLFGMVGNDPVNAIDLLGAVGWADLVKDQSVLQAIKETGISGSLAALLLTRYQGPSDHQDPRDPKIGSNGTLPYALSLDAYFKEQFEYGARVCVKCPSGKVYLGALKQGTSGGIAPNFLPPCEQGDATVAFVHSHPNKTDMVNHLQDQRMAASLRDRNYSAYGMRFGLAFVAFEKRFPWEHGTLFAKLIPRQHPREIAYAFIQHTNGSATFDTRGNIPYAFPPY